MYLVLCLADPSYLAWLASPPSLLSNSIHSSTERSLFVRERADGLYRVVTYLAAKMFDELTLMAFVSVAVSAAVFYAVGFQGSFLLFWLTYFVTLCNGIGEGRTQTEAGGTRDWRFGWVG